VSKNYVAYYLSNRKSAAIPLVYGRPRIDAEQETRLQAFLKEEANSVIASFAELPVSQRNRQRWPELEKAMAYCREHNATLIIAELRNLTNNQKFSDLLLNFIEQGSELVCCDQPFIDRNNFHALVQHARQHRKMHGQLIKQGLERTNARSGNPNAKEVIDRVNRPKIENAILFALLLQPIIEGYRQRGYSQRRMVNALNNDGIFAPEGGRWVLSQLQKVLERIKVNQAALALESYIKPAQAIDNAEDICRTLDQNAIVPPREKNWTPALLEEVQERLNQLHDLKAMNDLILNLMPLLAQHSIEDLSAELIAHQLYTNHVVVKNESLVTEEDA
jgi:hypothetical protein